MKFDMDSLELDIYHKLQNKVSNNIDSNLSKTIKEKLIH